METYLTAIGWWNFIGAFVMIGLYNPSFGRKIMNEWTKMFTTEFKLDYWGKFWLGWTIGLNIFFGAMNILSVYYAQIELQIVIICFDIFAYSFFLRLAFWGLKVGRCASGIYSAFVISFSGLAGEFLHLCISDTSAPLSATG